ncbi:FkbM family methyltransferase [Thermodesulfobacteriota bacterium]
MNFKTTIYRFGMSLLQRYWRLTGSRKIKAFGQFLRITPGSTFPAYRHLRLPKESYPSKIVRYTDFVQIHAVIRYVEGLIGTPTIINVGAHHGVYAMILGKIVQQREGKFIALEPTPEAFTVLLENVKLNNLENTVICEQVAALDKSGFADVKLNGSQSHILFKQGGGQVKVTTLQKLMDKYDIENVDLLIIDVEGAELPVLQGFPWESKRPGRIFCELHPYAWKDFGYAGEDLRLFLEKHRYRCFDMYLHEYTLFGKEHYIGPCFFVPN